MKKFVLALPFVALTVTGWAQHKPERDPFVNLAQKQQVQPMEQETHRKTPTITTRAHQHAAVHSSTPAPKISVLGLVTSSRQPKAIVAGAKNTFIVTQGDQLGDYRVARIDRSGITLAYKQSRYHLPLGE